MKITLKKAVEVGNALGLDWRRYDLEQFRLGLAEELEHGTAAGRWNLTGDHLITTAYIALAHLDELPDYYDRLKYIKKLKIIRNR